MKPYFLDINTQIQSLKEKGNREKGRIKVGEEKKEKGRIKVGEEEKEKGRIKVGEEKKKKGRIKVGEEKSIQIKLRNIKKKAKGKEYTKKRKK